MKKITKEEKIDKILFMLTTMMVYNLSKAINNAEDASTVELKENPYMSKDVEDDETEKLVRDLNSIFRNGWAAIKAGVDRKDREIARTKYGLEVWMRINLWLSERLYGKLSKKSNSELDKALTNVQKDYDDFCCEYDNKRGILYQD